MNQKKTRLIFIVLVAAVLITFIFSLVGPAFAQKTELIYPQIPGGAEPPNKLRTLPNYIKYMFNFGIAIAGIIAFASFAYGGVRYLASAGNPGTLSDAKSQILASLMGLGLLLGSWLLLTTINPKLVVLQVDKGDAGRQGIVLFAKGNANCDTQSPEQEGVDFRPVSTNLSDLTNAAAQSLNFPSREKYSDGTVRSIKFLDSSEEVDVVIYPQSNYQGTPSFRSADNPIIPAGTCQPVSAVSGSVQIIWKTPGVYLFSDSACIENAHLYMGDTASLGNFDNKAQSLKIIPSTTKLLASYSADELEGLPAAPPPQFFTTITNKLGVILFQKDGLQYDGAVFLGGEVKYGVPPEAECIPIAKACAIGQPGQEPYCKESVANEVSSLKIFNQYLLTEIPSGSQTTQLTNPPSGDGVTLFGNYEFNEQPKSDNRSGDDQKHCGPINERMETASSLGTTLLHNGKPLWVDGNVKYGTTIGSGDTASEENCRYLLQKAGTGRVSSIRVDGDYLAVLFRDDGRAEVFKAPGDYRLKDNNIGDDSARYLLVIPIAPNLSENRKSGPPPIQGNQCATAAQLCDLLVRPPTGNGTIPADSAIQALLTQLAMRANCEATNLETVKSWLAQSPCNATSGGTVGGVNITSSTVSPRLCTIANGNTEGAIYGAPGNPYGTKFITTIILGSNQKRSELLTMLKANVGGVANYCKTHNDSFCLLRDGTTKLGDFDQAQLDTVAQVCTDITGLK